MRAKADKPARDFTNMKVPRLTIEQILTWADRHRRATGKWPNPESGPVRGAAGETWSRINDALRRGARGLPGGGSLAQLLVRRRGARIQGYVSDLTEKQILQWADAHHNRTGKWPDLRSGPVRDAPGEHWATINNALQLGRRGLPGADSLAKLLHRRRGVRKRSYLARLSIAQVLRWAKAHRRRTGDWPNVKSGTVVGADRLTWPTLDAALRRGWRGLPGGTSLARLLEKHGG